MTENRKKIFDRVKTATVAIAALNKDEAAQPFTIFGSGFCIDPKGIIVTCRHVIEAMMEKSVAQQIAETPGTSHRDQIHRLAPVRALIPHTIFFDTMYSQEEIRAIPARVRNIIAKTDKDLAGLYLLPHTSLPKYPYLEIEVYTDIAEGDDIGVCGFPLGNYLYDQLGTVTSSFTKGILSSIIPGPNVPLGHLGGFQINVTATHGSSGGPVFSLRTGKVFGVLTRAVTHPSGGFVPGLVKAEPIYPISETKFIERLKKVPEALGEME